ncbi:MAG TPA: C39 family peptidase, partial [Blastocatellia bacterium]|nr:C39 family peptidase [Blastocatellia bacterium]
MRILPVDIERITELYDRGLYLQAYDGARSIAPLAEWEGTEARLIAGRLAAMLGAPKLARRLHLRAWRADRHDPQAIYYYTRALWDWRGAWRAWGFARRHPELSGAPIRIEAEWLGLRASLFGQLRDFDLAYEMIGRAEQLAPENPWIWVEKSSLLEYEDRYEEALAAANQSLQLRPLYRPAIQAATHLLGLLDREDEARDCLARATRHLECPALQIQLAQMLIDAGDHARAREHLELAVRLSPLMEEEVRQWLDGRRSDAAYLCGDLEAAAALAEGTKSSFFEEIAKRLRQATPEMRRVLLPVGFVRQHHVTCAPATLTMISRYWRMPAEHLEIAEEICYGGTSDHSERKWAEQNGWLAREFRVNWDDAVRLIDRGIPFTLATVDPGSAHLQAVIGYDERRGTLLIRDPYSPSLGEGLGTEMLEHYRSTGPRGMLLAPNGSAPQGNGGLRNWPDGVEPLEASLYDKLHAVQHALAHHDRAAADETWQAMSGEAPGHRLTLNARLAIASYDEDQHQALACIEELLGKYPDDANLKLQKVACLRMLARRSERLAYLKTICSDEKSDPLLWQQYAQELSEDAGESRTVSRLLHRSFRARPLEAHNFYLLANLRWSQRIFNEALELYRLAACLKDTNEQYVQSYFVASRHLRQTAAAME